MKWKVLTKTFIRFMKISNWKKPFGHGLYTHFSALWGLTYVPNIALKRLTPPLWTAGILARRATRTSIVAARWLIIIALVLQADSIPSKSVCYPTSAGSLCVAELPQRSKRDIKPSLPPPTHARIVAVTWTCCARFSSIVNRFSWHFMSAIFYSISSRYLHCKLSNVLIYEILRDNISIISHNHHHCASLYHISHDKLYFSIQYMPCGASMCPVGSKG